MSVTDCKLNNSFNVGNNEKIVILGAGPGGLMNAIRLIRQGCQPVILEKRPPSTPSRDNSVLLNAESLRLLKEEGIYQSLLLQKKIFPFKNKGFTVRLGDLENAMKSALEKLSKENIIYYQQQVAKLEEKNEKVSLVLENGKIVEDVDIIINAEGANSSTNVLLDNKRIQVLPKVPVIATIYKDTRPSITGPITLIKYMGITVLYTAKSIYYYAIFFFKLVFQKEFFPFSDRKIAGAIILKTPHQHYLGLGLNKKKSDELLELQKNVRSQEGVLKRETNPLRIKQQECVLKEAQKKLHSFVEFWSNIAFCEVNVAALVSRFMCSSDSRFCFAGRLAFDKFGITEIGADYVEHTYVKKGKTVILNIGDALATVDPTTGLGCNAALASSLHVQDFMERYREDKQDIDFALTFYNHDAFWSVFANHFASKSIRAIYRPDALL